MSLFAYLAGLVVFAALDAVWLILMGPGYHAAIGDMLAPDIRFVPAALFCLVTMLGVMIFVVRPGLRHGAAWVVAHGGLYGLFIVAGYDLGNLAVLKTWDPSLAVEDIVAGMVIGAIVSTLAWSIVRERGRRRR